MVQNLCPMLRFGAPAVLPIARLILLRMVML